MSDLATCPLLDDVVAEHADFRRHREAHPEAVEMGQRLAAETCREIGRRIQNMSAMSYAIAQVRRSHGLSPTEILTPRMVRDRLAEAWSPPPSIGPRVGLAPGLAETFQPKPPHA